MAAETIKNWLRTSCATPATPATPGATVVAILSRIFLSVGESAISLLRWFVRGQDVGRASVYAFIPDSGKPFHARAFSLCVECDPTTLC